MFAVRDANDTTVHLFGFGTYAGRDTPTEGVFAEAGIKNPRIDLDDGATVWGFQCWWGPIGKWDGMLAGRDVVTVPVPKPS